jgi:hypothetical protein
MCTRTEFGLFLDLLPLHEVELYIALLCIAFWRLIVGALLYPFASEAMPGPLISLLCLSPRATHS